MLLNGGPEFKFTEAVSFMIEVDDQQELDYFWHTFVDNGGEESMCGWCKDRFGLSWQVTPAVLGEIMTSGDQATIDRVTRAFLPMHKLDAAAIEAAAADG
jgi:predicted 3-demethylubiquinone-9 3-methyltransferase (glyoxalase superfamily)